MSTWRPANIKSFEGPEALHVVNQGFREANQRIDDVIKHQTPQLRGNATLNYGSIPGGTCKDRIVHMLGVNQNHVAHANPITVIGSNLSWSAQVNGSNNVLIRVCNITGGAVAANTIQWKVVAQ